MSEKEIRADAKLKNLPEEDLELLWSWRYPEDPKQKKSYTEIQVEIPLQWGFTVSSSTLSEFYSWLKQKRETAQAIARAEQAKIAFLEANPDASPEALHSVAQMVFTNKAMQTGDVKAWAKVAAIWERKKAREFNEKKFQAAMKSKLEAGLDALFEEIKGNEKAEQIFSELKKVLED